MDYDNPQYLGWYIIPYKNYQPTRVLNTAKVATTVWGNGSEKLSQGAINGLVDIHGKMITRNIQKPEALSIFVPSFHRPFPDLSGFKFPTNPMISSSNLLDPGLRVFLFLLFALHVVHFRHERNKWLGWCCPDPWYDPYIYIYIIHIISICFQHILYIFYNYRSMFSWAKKRPWDLRVWRSVLDHWKSFAMEPFGWQWHPLHPVEVLVAGQKYQTSWLQVARLPETDLLGCSTLISIIYI